MTSTIDDWYACEFIDAKGFVAWLEQHVSEEKLDQLTARSPRWSRGLYRWRHETLTVAIETVDAFLIDLDEVTLADVPVTLYRADPRRGNSPQCLGEEFHRFVAGHDGPHTAVAKRFGVSARSVAHWRKKVAA